MIEHFKEQAQDSNFRFLVKRDGGFDLIGISKIDAESLSEKYEFVSMTEGMYYPILKLKKKFEVTNNIESLRSEIAALEEENLNLLRDYHKHTTKLLGLTDIITDMYTLTKDALDYGIDMNEWRDRAKEIIYQIEPD